MESWIVKTEEGQSLIVDDIRSWCDHNYIIPQALYYTYDWNRHNTDLPFKYHQGYTLVGRVNDLIGVCRKIGWEDRDGCIVGIKLQSELRVLFGILRRRLAVQVGMRVIRPEHQFKSRC